MLCGSGMDMEEDSSKKVGWMWLNAYVLPREDDG